MVPHCSWPKIPTTAEAEHDLSLQALVCPFCTLLLRAAAALPAFDVLGMSQALPPNPQPCARAAVFGQNLLYLHLVASGPSVLHSLTYHLL